MSKKILVLDTTGCDWTDKNIALHPNVNCEAIYTSMPLCFRVLRLIHLNTCFGGKKIWYGKWFARIKEYSCIIIFSDIKSVSIFKDIRASGYTGKLVYYYRDPIFRKRIKPSDIIKENCDVLIATFDQEDAKRYNLLFNPQFYFRDNILNSCQYKYDAVFVGSDRGRLNDIKNMKELLDTAALSSYFYVLKDKNKYYNEVDYIHSSPLSYNEIINLNRCSKSIVEINEQGQVGMTVRAMEALFLKKKLITNNHSIMNVSFYNKNNIFVVGKDDISTLKEFIDSKYVDIDDEIVEFYSFSSWLERIEKG